MEEVREVMRRRGFKKIAASATASQALARLQSSHDALFVFSGQQFLGVVNLYYSFLRHHPQPQEKVERILYRPPHLVPSDSLLKAARLMAEARLYWLPVLEEGNFRGAVSAETILRRLARSPQARQPLAEVGFSPAIYLDEKATLAQARQLMLHHKTTRLIVTRRQKPVGILSSYDLRQKKLAAVGSRPRLGNRTSGGETPIRDLYHRGLVTVDYQVNVRQALRQLLTAAVGSLVVVREGKIVGLVSYRNFLKYFSRPTFRPPWRLNFRLNLPAEEKLFFNRYLGQLFQRRPILREKIQRLDLVFSRQTRHPSPKAYQVTARVWASGQKAFTLIIRGGHPRRLLPQIARKIKEQIKKS